MSYIRHAERLATIELFVERALPGDAPLETPRFFLRAIAGNHLVFDTSWLTDLNDPKAAIFFDDIIAASPETLKAEKE